MNVGDLDFFRSDEPTLITLSGGRTSAYMLRRVLDAYGGKLPSHFVVCFANTGKEMPQTLDFLHRLETEWDFPLTWLEYAGRTARPTPPGEPPPKRQLYDYRYRVADYASASRNGEPFAQLIDDIGKLPGPVNRFCSGQLKVRTMMRYLEAQGWELPVAAFIGIRADEKRRAVKLQGRIVERQECLCPLYQSGVTREEVGEFWRGHPLDLELPNVGGVTDWGNCDLCFLKGKNKRVTILREQPGIAAWWNEQEGKTGQIFDNRRASVQQLVSLATDTGALDFGVDDSIPCFCGD